MAEHCGGLIELRSILCAVLYGLQKGKKPDWQVCDYSHHFLLGIAVCELPNHQLYHIADVHLSAAVCTGRLYAYD